MLLSRVYSAVLLTVVTVVFELVVAREARGQGRYRKSFEVVRLDGLTTERVTGDVAALPLFQRWQDPAWKRQTLSLR